MARIDKTDSAVGVVRAELAFDVSEDDYGKMFGAGLNSSGRIVKGAGNSGIIGLLQPDRTRRKAGMITDLFVLGDALEMEGLTAGSKVYADDTTGELSTTAPVDPATGVQVGYTVEADRLVIRL